MKVTVLVDNIEDGGLQAEWGLAFLIEYRDKRILLDTGASGMFIENSRKLGIDLEDIDYGVLSHAHYDHSDGIEDFFKLNDHTPFYLQKSCKENCYSRKWIFSKYIGIQKGLLEKYPERIIYVDGDKKLGEGIDIIAHHTENLEKIGIKEQMYLKMDKGWKPDDFAHEQSLVLETSEGLVVFNSCSHGGALNIINEIEEIYYPKKVVSYLGGLHQFNKKEDEVRYLATQFKKHGVKKVYTGHCTGEKAYRIMKEELGDNIELFHSGMVYEFKD